MQCLVNQAVATQLKSNVMMPGELDWEYWIGRTGLRDGLCGS